ncbi:MAG: hypothetical protein FWB72_01430 [Firmicutes bacterium]|nr:hypothetical protein [Bacillota bacterium]
MRLFRVLLVAGLLAVMAVAMVACNGNGNDNGYENGNGNGNVQPTHTAYQVLHGRVHGKPNFLEKTPDQVTEHLNNAENRQAISESWAKFRGLTPQHRARFVAYRGSAPATPTAQNARNARNTRSSIDYNELNWTHHYESMYPRLEAAHNAYLRHKYSNTDMYLITPGQTFVQGIPSGQFHTGHANSGGPYVFADRHSMRAIHLEIVVEKATDKIVDVIYTFNGNGNDTTAGWAGIWVVGNNLRTWTANPHRNVHDLIEDIKGHTIQEVSTWQVARSALGANPAGGSNPPGVEDPRHPTNTRLLEGEIGNPARHGAGHTNAGQLVNPNAIVPTTSATLTARNFVSAVINASKVAGGGQQPGPVAYLRQRVVALGNWEEMSGEQMSTALESADMRAAIDRAWRSFVALSNAQRAEFAGGDNYTLAFPTGENALSFYRRLETARNALLKSRFATEHYVIIEGKTYVEGLTSTWGGGTNPVASLNNAFADRANMGAIELYVVFEKDTGRIADIVYTFTPDVSTTRTAWLGSWLFGTGGTSDRGRPELDAQIVGRFASDVAEFEIYSHGGQLIGGNDTGLGPGNADTNQRNMLYRPTPPTTTTPTAMAGVAGRDKQVQPKMQGQGQAKAHGQGRMKMQGQDKMHGQGRSQGRMHSSSQPKMQSQVATQRIARTNAETPVILPTTRTTLTAKNYLSAIVNASKEFVREYKPGYPTDTTNGGPGYPTDTTNGGQGTTTPGGPGDTTNGGPGTTTPGYPGGTTNGGPGTTTPGGPGGTTNGGPGTTTPGGTTPGYPSGNTPGGPTYPTNA